MLKTYFKYAFRSLLKNKVVLSINTLGLGLGLTVAVFVMLYTAYEFSFDKWIPENDRVFRVYRQWEGGNGNTFTPSPAAKLLKEEVVGVESATRVLANYDMLLENEGIQHKAAVMYSVDSNFFQTVPMEFKYGGNGNMVFKQLDAAVLSNKLAQQIFGDTDPIGQNLLIENSHLVQITGVLSLPKGPTHFEADLYVNESLGTTSWTGGNGNTYVKINAKAKPEQVAANFSALANSEIIKERKRKNREVDPAKMAAWKFQPITQVHLGSSNIGGGGLITGSYRQVGIMLLLGLVVLALAIINYINLATAQLKERAAEVGVRKVIGASKNSLVGQFVTESLLSVVLSFIVALAVVQLFMPAFNGIVGRQLDIYILLNWEILTLVVGLLFIVSALTGFFPAYYFASLSPMSSIKGQKLKGDKTHNYRNILVVFQFSLSIGLILFVSIVWTQVDYMIKRELGFKGDQIAVFRINKDQLVQRFPDNKQRLLNIPGVEAVSQISRPPGSFIPNYSLAVEGMEKDAAVDMMFVDTDWNEVFNISLKEGRFLSNDYTTDTAKAFVVNEAFVRRNNIDQPVGHRMKFIGDEEYGQIVGVVEDFHFRGLQEQITPLAICARTDKNWMGRVAIKIADNDMAATIAQIEKEWKALEPGFPVTFNFIDQQFEEQYESYIRFGTSLLYTTICCIIIALLGLLGLTFFMTQQRSKEIGIRKILGASISNIIGMLSANLLKLVLIAIVISIPIALYFAKQWLRDFAYQTTIHWWLIMGVAIGTLMIALLTTGLQSLKVATTNPVNALRDE